MSKQTGSAAKPTSTSPAPGFYDKYIQGREVYFLFGIILVVSYFVFSDFIRLKKVYLFRDIGSDSINIYFPGIAFMSDYIRNESAVIGWSFQQGMGQNMFPFYVSDFFSNFVTFFDKSQIPYWLVFMELIKIVLSGFVFFKFLKQLQVTSFAAFITALMYSFSGYMILGGCWTVFSTEALYAAVILYGFERWLQQGKFFWLVIGITLMALLQPFFLFMYTLLLAGYAIVRYYDVREKDTKKLLLFVAKTVGVATVAVLISSWQLFADLLQYSESPRVGGEASFFAKLQKQPLFGFADPLLRFTTVFRSFGSDMIGTGNEFRGWQNYLEAPLFYCGILSLVAFPQFFSSLNKRQKYFYGILTFLLCLPILFPYFRYAFWAFTGDYFRTFSLVIVLFMLIYTCRALAYIERERKINTVVLGVTVVFLLILLYSPAAQFKQGINTSLRSFATFLLLAYAVLLFLLAKRSGASALAKVGLLALCIIELATNSNITVNKRDVMTRELLREKVGYNDYTVEAVAFLKQRDKQFFRVNKDYMSGMAIHGSMNDAKVQGFYGTQSYFSFNQKNYIRFLADLEVIDPKDELATRWAKGLSERPVLFSLCSGKYWLSKRTDNALAGMGMDSIAKFGDVKVLSNRYALPFGVTYNQVVERRAFKQLSPAQRDFAILRACVIDSADVPTFTAMKNFNVADTLAPMSFDNYKAYGDALKKDSLTVTRFSENHIEGAIQTAAPKILFLSIPFDEGWSAKLNGAEARLYRVNCGLTGLVTASGNNKLELDFKPRYKKEGGYMSVAALVAFGGLLVLTRRKKEKEASV